MSNAYFTAMPFTAFFYFAIVFLHDDRYNPNAVTGIILLVLSVVSLVVTVFTVQDVPCEPDVTAITQAVHNESSVFDVDSRLKRVMGRESTFHSNGPSEAQRPNDGFRGELTIPEVLQIFSLPPNQLGLTVSLLVVLAFTNTLSIAESVLIPILARTNHVFTVSSVILATYLVFYVYHAYEQRASYLQTQISDHAIILSMLLLNLVGSLTLVFTGQISLIGTLALMFVAISLVGLPVSLSLFIKQIGIKLTQ